MCNMKHDQLQNTQLTAEKLSQFLVHRKDCAESETSDPPTFTTYTRKQFTSFLGLDFQEILRQTYDKISVKITLRHSRVILITDQTILRLS